MRDQDILLEDVEEHKKLPVTTIQNWLALYKHHLVDIAHAALKNSLQGVSTITNYFSFI